MSNYSAIATVTAVLRDLLQEAVSEDVPGATATFTRPDGPEETLPKPGVNIYLFQASPCAHRRNEDLPTRTGAGQVLQRPKAFLYLDYLLTFYDGEGELEAQRVLGSATNALHANPLVTRQRIAAAAQTYPYLAESDLGDAADLVRVFPIPLSLEELSKLWSVFFQIPYSLSVAYRASTVIIEGEETPRRSLPVRIRHINVMPFQRAVIEDVVAATGDEDPLVLGETAIVRGRGLSGNIKAVRVGGTDLDGTPISDAEIRVELTDSDLRAGVVAVQVHYPSGLASNVVPVVLHPVIALDNNGEPRFEFTPTDDENPATLTVHMAHEVGERQQVSLLLNQTQLLAAEQHSYVIEAQARDDVTDELTFLVPMVTSGTYLVRIQIDGAETLLSTDADGNYTTPTTEIQ